MKREIRLSEKIWLAGLIFIFVFMLVHDWVPLGPLNDVEAIRQDSTFQELFFVTLINAGQILLFIVLLLIFMGKRYPIWVKLWLVIHQSCIFAGALWAWWIPYFFGIGAAERVERYELMFGNTHTFLPEMHGIAPNTIHTIFHLTLLTCIILSIYIGVTDSKRLKQENKTNQMREKTVGE